MKHMVILFFSFLSACASNSNLDKSSALSFEKVRLFKVGVSSENDVVKALGQPAERTEKDGYFTLTYNDPKTSFQRLSVNFISGNGVVTGILWIPSESDKEFSLDSAKLNFKNAKFQESPSDDRNPHIISDVKSLTDENLGVVIRFNRKSVEAIALYDVKSRLPSATRKNRTVPYTFGDEPSVSR